MLRCQLKSGEDSRELSSQLPSTSAADACSSSSTATAMLAQSTASTSPSSSHTVPPTSEHKRKKERYILSCLTCRGRKVSCDRKYPVCGRCVKGGVAAYCTYKNRNSSGDIEGEDGEIEMNGDEGRENRPRLDGPVLTTSRELPSHGPPFTTSVHENTIKRLESRLADLERVVARNSVSSARDNFGDGCRSEETRVVKGKETETNVFKGRGFRTQFYGASSPTSLLAHVSPLNLKCCARS